MLKVEINWIMVYAIDDVKHRLYKILYSQISIQKFEGMPYKTV